MATYSYHICDVFTEGRSGGNPLAVVPHAEGLTDLQMQWIAHEFGYSETAFAFSSKAPLTRQVRIFTPVREVPFAGHPNVGTAFVLAGLGEFGPIQSSLSVTFEEAAGSVPVTIRAEGGEISSCELTAPQSLSLQEAVPLELVAAALSIPEGEIVTETHHPLVASVGLPFVMAEVLDHTTLGRVRANPRGFEAILARDIRPSIYLYTRTADGPDIRARMFAPLNGVPEDPATGSAACAIAGLLAQLDGNPHGEFRWRIIQGAEMGRPSTLVAYAEKRSAVVRATGVGGACVLVRGGSLEVEQSYSRDSSSETRAGPSLTFTDS